MTHIERSSSIRINLMHRNGYGPTSLHLGNLLSSQGILGVLANVDVPLQLCSATLINNVGCDFLIPNQSGILLARADGGAVPWDGLDHYEKRNVSVGQSRGTKGCDKL